MTEPPLTPLFFFFNDTATTEIYTLSLHDALPIWGHGAPAVLSQRTIDPERREDRDDECDRSEEHTSELQSPCNLVCRLLLEKKKNRPPPCRHLARRRRLGAPRCTHRRDTCPGSAL